MNLSENDEAKTLSRSAIGNSIPKKKEDCETKIHHNKMKYRKVASCNTSRLEAHAGLFRLLMKGIFDPYVPFDKKLIS